MPVAITLRLDTTTASKIEAILEALPDRRTDNAAGHQGYPAHITLAVYDDRVDVADLDAALATATGTWKKLPITLAAIGVFVGAPSTLWLAPIPTADLLALHTTLHRSLTDLGSHPHYEVGAWVPHVTLARTTLLADAIEVLASLWTGPIIGWLDSLDLVRFEPVEVLSSHPLRD